MKSIILSIVMLCMSGLTFAEEAPVVRECQKEEVVCEKMTRKIHKQPVKKVKCKLKVK
jgi:hypothetical protein